MGACCCKQKNNDYSYLRSEYDLSLDEMLRVDHDAREAFKHRHIGVF